MAQVLLQPPAQFNSSDSTSLSNIDQVVCTHHDISLNIDFNQKRLSGKIEYTLNVLKETTQVDLDIRNIQVSSCTLGGQALSFKIVQYEKITQTLGDQLQITLPSALTEGTTKITVEFNTIESKESSLNWLNPSQTQGKVHPFMFTQSQPIWNRTVFPCQDTPGVKSTFTAQVTVPKPYKAFVSGRVISEESTESTTTIHFSQHIPIPSYLFAIVAGNLAEKKVSDRTSVITEPEDIDRCFKELEDMEVQLQTLEKFITPYEWKEYKVVVLPPSFPYGGMENPLLTFASPSIIVGDKSSTDVVIHEMAHSWSGNLFSCKNWNSFWLNEGWTVFFESEAVRILHGEEAYDTKFTLNDNDLKKCIDGIGHDHSYSTLNPEIGYDNPDDAFSSVPYIRGFQLLTHLQNTVGAEAFQKFFRSFVNTFRLKSLDTNEFLNFFKQHFGEEVYNKIDWDAWINKRGYPPQVFNIKGEGVAKTKAAALAFLESNTLSKEQWDSFQVEQKIIFLQQMSSDKFTHEKAVLLDTTLYLSEVKNPEIYTTWFTPALAVRYEPVVPLVQKHLSLHGRMKFVRGVYKSLSQYNHELAVETFKANQSMYYGITYILTKEMLKI